MVKGRGTSCRVHEARDVAMTSDHSYSRSIVCGAFAGLAVDLSLYPVDTIKTRLQSAQGFVVAGGMRHLYRGMGSVAVGSAPSAALFFSSYNMLKHSFVGESVVVHALSASASEVVACLVRVPTELIKQRAQAHHCRSLSTICYQILKDDGLFGFYRGFFSTTVREIPFALIEFPLWEALKKEVIKRSGKDQCSPLASAACGSVAGGVAAAISTPFDVAKTRIMLTEKAERDGLWRTMSLVWREGGFKRLYAGVVPRTLLMTIGGFVFFGVYQQVDSIWQYTLTQ